jgi:hypothetical protein
MGLRVRRRSALLTTQWLLSLPHQPNRAR